MRRIDPWVTLGVKPGDDEATLKAAYYEVMAKAHPDHGGDREAASDANRAYAFLRAKLAGGKVPTPEQAGLVLRPPQAPWQGRPWTGARVIIITGGGAANDPTTTTSVSFGGWSPWWPQTPTTGGR